MRGAAFLPLLVLLGAAAHAAVQGGIAVEMTVGPASPGAGPAPEPREGDAAVRFRISDAATGTPLSGAAPAAWMEPLAAGESAEGRCTDRVKEFLSGNLFNRPAVDLNVYYVLALNQDATLTVVDPLFGFGGTKLLAQVELDSPGEDWALSRDGARLFVSMPDANRVAVVDTATWKKVASLDAGPRPGRVALQADGAYLWVAFETGVAALDARSLTVAARIPTGRGRHDLALSDDDRFAFVTNGDDGTVSVIDVAKLAKIRDVGTGPAPVSVAWSAQARAAYVTSEEGGVITAAAPEGDAREPVRIAAEPGLGAIRFAPGGRLAFVLNPRLNRVYILDGASNRIVQRTDVEHGPDQVTFTRELAYLRQRGSETVLMVPLAEIGKEGAPVPAADFTGGQNPLGKGSRPSLADSIVRAPGAAAVLVANPRDGVIYFYKEGMAAPMGSFTNYGREPRAVLVVDRSLRERSPGSYETVARLQPPGRYRLAFFLDAPRTVQCFEVNVAADPVLAAQRLRERPVKVEPRLPGTDLRVGEAARLRFRLTDPASGQAEDGLTDVEVLVFLSSGTWHKRQRARGVGDGVYEVELVPPVSGVYNVAVECPSRRLSFHSSPQIVLRAAAGRPAASP